MNLLFVSTVPVFPPTDGVRIPPAHYIDGLSKTHEVDFLLLELGARNAAWESDCQTTANAVRRFWQAPMRRRPTVVGLARELSLLGPFYGSWELAADFPKSLVEQTYDGVIACTPTSIAFLAQPNVRHRLPHASVWIAAMSDVHSLVLSQLAANASKNHRVSVRLFHSVVFALRSQILARNEMKMLDRYNRVLVQTDKEYDWVCRSGNDGLAAKTVPLSNAAPDPLFLLPVERSRRHVVFVGSMAGLYGERFHWFIHKVWKEARATTELSLTAIGRGASEKLTESMRVHDVDYVPYVEDLNDVYRNHDILVAPIFKGYGLINKVIEAMAAGCVVVGDATAFNGIPDFVPGEHGLVANSEREFIDVLQNDLHDEAKLNAIRIAARELMEKHFRWEQRIETIENALSADVS